MSLSTFAPFFFFAPCSDVAVGSYLSLPAYKRRQSTVKKHLHPASSAADMSHIHKIARRTIIMFVFFGFWCNFSYTILLKKRFSEQLGLPSSIAAYSQTFYKSGWEESELHAMQPALVCEPQLRQKVMKNRRNQFLSAYVRSLQGINSSFPLLSPPHPLARSSLSTGDK